MYKWIVTILVCLTWTMASTSCAQQDQEAMAELTKMLSEPVENEEVIGHEALIYHQGQIVFRERYGLADRDKKTPLTKDTIFRIYSMSKPITSVAAMQLVESGKLKLDDPVHKHLPEFAELTVLDGDAEVEPTRPMTVRDLMRHTSGLTYGFFGDTPVDKQYKQNQIMILDRNLEHTVTKLGRIPLLHQPGQRFHYSISTDVLGRLIEVVSGKRLGEYLQANVFEPLGMKDTSFYLPAEKKKRMPQMYDSQKKGMPLANPMLSYRYLNKTDYESGGAGLCSTIEDFLQFSKMLLNRGTLNEKTVLSPASVKQMFTNQLGDVKESSDSFRFGLGFRCYDEGDYGWGGFAGTRFWIHPEKQTVVIYMTQIHPYRNRAWAHELRRTAYRAIDKLTVSE